MKNTAELELAVKLTGVEEAVKKAEQLTEKIREARTLAGELASMLGDLKIEL